MAADEAGGFAAEGGGGVIEGWDGVGAVLDAVRVGVAVGTAEEAEEFVEAALERVVIGGATEVPFADEAGVVAVGFEAVGEGGFGEGETGSWA